jgi:hygromycin-B 7''-O-kinase
MARLTPEIPDRETYLRVMRDEGAWRPALSALARRHGLDEGAFARAEDGSSVVFVGPEAVIKIYPPLWPEERKVEVAVMEAAQGALPVQIPALIAHGTLDEDMGYVVMTRVEGVAARQLWGELSLSEQREVMGALGACLAALHQLPTAPLEALTPPWAPFLAARIEGAEAHHRARGAAEPWLAELRALLAARAPSPTPRVALLHADITADHVLLTRRGGRWVFSGLIDFADATPGDPWYDLIAPVSFLAARRPGLTEALMDGIGLPTDADARRELLVWCLLHRFGHLQQILRLCGEPAPNGLDELEQALWGR